jgi:hypothetical protein
MTETSSSFSSTLKAFSNACAAMHQRLGRDFTSVTAFKAMPVAYYQTA